MPFKITKSTKLQYFQFKINRGYFPTNRYLNKVNKPDTNFYQYCDVVFIMKYYIYKCKWKNTALSFKAFKENVKYELKLEKEGEKNRKESFTSQAEMANRR